MSASNWNETVDEILDKLVDDVFGLHSVLAKAKIKAKAAITVAVKEHVIGEDNLNQWGGTLGISNRAINRNALRAEQRRALELREEK